MSAITAKARRKMKKYAVLTREPRCFLGSFDFSWEQRKLGDNIAEYTEKTTINNQYPVLTSSRRGIFFQTDYYDGNQIASADNTGYNIVPYGYFTYRHMSDDEIFHFNINDITENGIVSTLYPVFTTDENLDSRYLQYQLNYGKEFAKYAVLQKQGGSRTYMYLNKLKELRLTIPNFVEEQKKISAYFMKLDNFITLHQRKCVFLFSFFRACISMNFTASTFSWEQRKVGNLLIERNQQAPMSDEYPLMAFIANEGVAPKGERYDRSALVTDTVNKLYKKTEKGDFIYSSNNLETGSIGLNKYGKACISPVYSIFEPTGIADSDFLGRRLVRKDFINAMVKWRQGVIYGQWRIHESDFLKIEITVPSVEEQRKIGAYLDQLDNLITLHQRKFEKLTNVKKSMLEKMFPQNGSSYPEIRFKGFTDPWEQRKFGEVFDCTVPNNTLSRVELSYDEGTVLNVHYGDVLIKYGSVLDVQKDDIPRIPHRCIEDFNGALLQDGDVIIADTAEDETTGKACEIGNLQGSAIVSGLHTMVCRPRNRMALGYLGYYLNSNAYHHQLLPLMQGIKVLSLSRSNIQKTTVSYPSAMKEQQLIASYFSQLDHLITLHQRKPFLMKWRTSDANRNQTNRLVL